MNKMKNLYLCNLCNNIMGTDLVFKNSEGQPVTNSLLVAQKFGKRHADVLRIIRDLDTQIAEVSKNECKRSFAFTSQLIEQPNGGWREEAYCTMTRDGFSLLVMGFTGREALRFKLMFIEGFNRMEEAIRVGLPSEAELQSYIYSCVEQCIERKLSAPGKAQLTVAQELDVREDMEAYRFFDSYCTDSERPYSFLNKVAAREYYANACVLNAIANLLLKLYGIKGRSRRYSKIIFFEQAVKLAQQVDVSRWPHTLPTTSRRFREKYYRYIKEGYESLIHRGFNNQRARKF
jgi:Rha family phage regulatory protein